MNGTSLQAFRSQPSSQVIFIPTRHDAESGKDIVRWKDIQQYFKDAQGVMNDHNAVLFLTGDDLEDFIPLRIAHYPDVVLQVVVPDGSKDSSSLLSKNDMSWPEQLRQEVQQAHQKMEEILGKIQQADQRTQSFVQQIEQHVNAAQQSIQQSDQYIRQLEEDLQTSRQQLQQVEEYQQTMQQIDQGAQTTQQQTRAKNQNFIDRTLEICGLFGLMYAWYVMYAIASYPLSIVYGVMSIMYLVC
ncbi:hypothetical protein BGX34_003593 [Mortierella sp. NVP85]|nr:hypothetical protein BGX34_003593 [Mortierella sp. NVP85]